MCGCGCVGIGVILGVCIPVCGGIASHPLLLSVCVCILIILIKNNVHVFYMRPMYTVCIWTCGRASV